MEKSNLKALKDYAITISVAVAIAFLIRSYLIEAYRIRSSTMKPTLLPGDTIFVAKWPFQLSKSPTPNRGDIVIFSRQTEEDTRPSNSIKRIVGLPGDRIALKNGSLFLNDKPLATVSTGSPQGTLLQEAFTPEKPYSIEITQPVIPDIEPTLIPAGSVFVIGDSRSNSKSESNPKKLKNWEIVPLSSLKGKALSIWLSIDSSHSNEKSGGNDWPQRWLPHFRLDRMFRRVQ